MIFLVGTAAGYAFHSDRGDIAGALVISWSLLGIFQHQHTPVIHWFAFASFILSLGAIGKALYGIRRSGHSLVDGVLHSDEEARPILQGSS